MLPVGLFPRTDQSPVPDGVFVAGHGGAQCPQRVYLLPYCEGPAGASFSMRVYGWRGQGLPTGDPNKMVWIPTFLAEFACASGELPGPASDSNSQSIRNMLDTERLCETIALTQGALGLEGYVNSCGSGSGLVASAILETTGCRYLQFDFQQTDQVSMNCFWAWA